jgi:hypothetical protein
MKLRTNTRLAGVFITLTLGAMALSACGGDSGTTSGGKSNADLLKEAAANMKAAKSYVLTADVDQAGQAVKMNGQIDVANNNTKMDMEASGQKISIISVGNDVFLSMDGGTTYTSAGAAGASMTAGFASFTGMWSSFQDSEIDKAKDALKDGSPATEKINGVDCKHITASAKDLSGLGGTTGTTEGTIDLWISTDKAYVRQMKLDATSDGQPIKGTFTWDKFNENFDIKAPPTASKLDVLTAASR